MNEMCRFVFVGFEHVLAIITFFFASLTKFNKCGTTDWETVAAMPLYKTKKLIERTMAFGWIVGFFAGSVLFLSEKLHSEATWQRMELFEP